MQITIASIDQKPKHSFIITSENRRLRCWNDKVAKFGLEQGATYEAETEDSEYNGTTLTYITKAKRVADPPPAAAPRGPAAAGAAFRTPEQSFVSEVICAYIGNGRCEPAKMTEIIGYVRAAWNDHWGEGGA